jgi:hypothetical protein
MYLFFIVIICILFYDVFPVNKYYIASNNRVIGEWWFVQDLEGSGTNALINSQNVYQETNSLSYSQYIPHLS